MNDWSNRPPPLEFAKKKVLIKYYSRMTQFSGKNNTTIHCVAVSRISFQPIEMTVNQSQRFNVMTTDKIAALTHNSHNII